MEFRRFRSALLLLIEFLNSRCSSHKVIWLKQQGPNFTYLGLRGPLVLPSIDPSRPVRKNFFSPSFFSASFSSFFFSFFSSFCPVTPGDPRCCRWRCHCLFRCCCCCRCCCCFCCCCCCKWSSRGTCLLQMIIQRIQPLINDYSDRLASCKWSSGGSGHLQKRDRPLASDHLEGPASYKWSSVTPITLVTTPRIQI